MFMTKSVVRNKQSGVSFGCSETFKRMKFDINNLKNEVGFMDVVRWQHTGPWCSLQGNS